MKTYVDRRKEDILVTLVHPADAAGVLGSPVNVYPAQKVWDGKTVEVHGLSPSTSPDALELFFDDKRRSVEVDYIQMDTGKDVAYVTFLNIDGAAMVLSKRTLSLDGANLTVRPKLKL
ncbi:hypothetical protein LSAT2_005215 [Lamellibrachia satsuma]|nr:hypothetical protein LSAT2_005215 [Lamellibrachia satsuma]